MKYIHNKTMSDSCYFWYAWFAILGFVIAMTSPKLKYVMLMYPILSGIYYYFAHKFYKRSKEYENLYNPR